MRGSELDNKDKIIAFLLTHPFSKDTLDCLKNTDINIVIEAFELSKLK